MRNFSFRGEESARFARFATELVNVFGGNIIEVSLEGREPLTSKLVNIRGRLVSALDSGYRRHVVVTEYDTNTIYWAAGTNATSSICTELITFSLSDDQEKRLVTVGKNNNWFVPMLADKVNPKDAEWCFVDCAAQVITSQNAMGLISLLNSESILLVRESALALRSYVNYLSHYIRQRTACEKAICQALESPPTGSDCVDAQIALTELLGYIGTSKSIPVLKNLINSTMHSHVKWAAIIAIGRLPYDNIVDILIEAAKKVVIDSQHHTVLEREGVSDAEWVEAALLLCISRRVVGIVEEEQRNWLETYFSSYFVSSNLVLHRYACLGLNQLGIISETTIDSLLRLISDASHITEKGYYAMAILPMFRMSHYAKRSLVWNEERLAIIRNVLSATSRQYTITSEPDSIWGLENLADLSLEIESNDLAFKFHTILAESFVDWRFSYYEALAAYEKAELAIARNRPHFFVFQQFKNALTCLEQIEEDDEYAMSVILFRQSIIETRIHLLEVLYDWQSASTHDSLMRLKDRMQTEVINSYNLYMIGEGRQVVFKREIDCIHDTICILEIIRKIITFHAELYSYTSLSEELQNMLIEISVDISQITEQEEFSMEHTNVLNLLTQKILNVKKEFEVKNGYENVLRLMREIVSFVNSISWTMPAQMCMLNGLGKGSISVVNENHAGQGTATDPYVLYSDKNSIDILLSINLEVITGSAIQTAVVCETTKDRKQLSGIVEGTALCDFEISNRLATLNRSIPFTFYLEFSTNDIVQKGMPVVFYFRSDALENSDT